MFSYDSLNFIYFFGSQMYIWKQYLNVAIGESLLGIRLKWCQTSDLFLLPFALDFVFFLPVSGRLMIDSEGIVTVGTLCVITIDTLSFVVGGGALGWKCSSRIEFYCSITETRNIIGVKLKLNNLIYTFTGQK